MSKDITTIIKFTGTDYTSHNTYRGDFSNSIVDWGDGTIESPSQLIHTYIDNNQHTIQIINAPYSTECFAYSLMTNISIPTNITEIGTYCFYKCNNLTSINVPYGVTTLGEGAFYYCDNLIDINIPTTITTIPRICFAYCPNLRKIYLNWTTSNEIVSYSAQWVYSVNNDFKYYIPHGTTSLYRDKGYPPQLLQEVTS